MRHRLTGCFLNAWLLKKRGKWRDVFGGRTLDAMQVIHSLRHLLRQGHRDYKRRGLSNREGANNRRWRKYLAARPRVEVFGTIVWPDYAIDPKDWQG